VVDLATGKTHPVLDPTTVPAPTVLPAGVRALPLTWDEKRRVAFRRWQSGSSAAGTYLDVWLSVGSRSGIEAGAPTPGHSSLPVAIGRRTGRLWHGRGPFDVVVIRWPLPDGRLVEVRTVDESTTHGTVRTAESIARSVA
jgi:hypothetical protein